MLAPAHRRGKVPGGTLGRTGLLQKQLWPPTLPFSLPHWLASLSLSLSHLFSPPFVILPFSCPSSLLSTLITFSPNCLSSFFLFLALFPPDSSPLCSPSFSFPTVFRSVQVLKSLHGDKLIKDLTESLPSSSPEPLEAEPRTSHRDGLLPGKQEWGSTKPSWTPLNFIPPLSTL